MQYSRCQFYIILKADIGQKRAFPILGSTLFAYVRHACKLLNCDLIVVNAIDSSLHVLIELVPNISFREFTKKLILWTSSWITKDVNPDHRSYWGTEIYARCISPEEKENTIDTIKNLSSSIDPVISESLFSKIKLNNEQDFRNTCACHHIIFTTYNEKLSLRLKYMELLVNGLREVCNTMGIKMIDANGIRNHMHLLCHLPLTESVEYFVATMKAKLLEWMHANIHFRRFEGWSDNYWAFTVSPTTINDEEYAIYRQEKIHSFKALQNEMAYYSKKLNVPYIVSLR